MQIIRFCLFILDFTIQDRFFFKNQIRFNEGVLKRATFTVTEEIRLFGHLRRSITLTIITERLAVELSLSSCFNAKSVFSMKIK